MNTLREAAQRALEALEPYADIKPRDWKTDREKLWRAFDALRAALAEPDDADADAERWRYVNHPDYFVVLDPESRFPYRVGKQPTDEYGVATKPLNACIEGWGETLAEAIDAARSKK
jgi:hypothetical protein